MFGFKRERVEFLVNNLKVIGNLFIPKKSFSEGQIAVIIVGPMTSVKEQVTGVYAEALAKQGMVTLAMDHRYFGESEGEPRQYEKFPDKIYDIQNAFEYIKTRPEVNINKVCLVGVCLGAGYVLATAAETPGIYKLAAIAGYYRDTIEMKKTNTKDFDSKLFSGVKARELYELKKEVLTIPAASLTQEAAMQTKDTVDYYTRRALTKNYKNSFAVMSREYFVNFNVQSYAKRITCPILMIHSQKALSPHWAEKFYANVKAKKIRQLIKSNGQTDFYDNPIIIDDCVERVTKHFSE